MRTIVSLLVAAWALSLCGTAWAKGSVPDRVCGASTCVQLDGRPESIIILDANAARPAPAPSAYYRIHYSAAGAGPHLFVPHGNRLAAETAGGRALQWYALYGRGPERLRTAIRQLRPITAPAQWPTSIEVPAVVSGSDQGSTLEPWLFSMALVLLAGLAIFVRRARVSARTA
jgi:hypothetical protein